MPGYDHEISNKGRTIKQDWRGIGQRRSDGGMAEHRPRLHPSFNRHLKEVSLPDPRQQQRQKHHRHINAARSAPAVTLFISEQGSVTAIMGGGCHPSPKILLGPIPAD